MKSPFAKVLKELRMQKGYSQNDLAEKLGVKSGKQTIYNWESEKTEPSLSDIRRIAEVLETTTYYLLEGHDPETPKAEEPKPGYIIVPMEEYIDLQRRVIKQMDQEKGEKPD